MVHSGIDGNIIGVRAKTLIALRWAAIAGQAITISVVHFLLGFQLPLSSMVPVVLASAALNVYLQFYGRPARVTERQLVFTLIFDTVQLTMLLYMAGGLQNPFAAMLLIYVMIASAILSRRNLIIIAGTTFACLTALAFFHHPLPWRDGGLLLDRLYSCGVWSALMIASAFTTTYINGLVKESRQMANALAAAQAALEKEQRMSALGGLAAATAHQLATPLNSITLIAHDLRDELPHGHKLRQDAELLCEQAQQCSLALSSLSQRASRAATMDNVASVPFRVIVELSAQNQAHVRPEIELHIHERAESLRQWTVPMRAELLHALGNLIQNARRHASRRVDIALDAAGDMARVTVRDDGPGYPDELLPDLGEPYIKRQGAYDGMGLGIFISKSLLDKMSASVSFANDPMGGAVATIELDLSMGTMMHQKPVSEAA